MRNPFSFFSHCKKPKTTIIPFKDFYTNWFNTIDRTFLPLLHHSLSSTTFVSSPSLLSSHVILLHHHFLSYYDSLDFSATYNPVHLPYLLFPSWNNNPLLTPFLFIGDLHPYLFTNLLRSFLDEDDDMCFPKRFDLDCPWPVAMAWKDPSKSLVTKIEQIECGLRLMVPALMDRVKKAQVEFVGKVAEKWVSCWGKEKVEVEEAMKVEMEELVSVFVDANRLRRNVISEIVGALNDYQGALFLQGLAQFLVGLKNQNLLHEFNRSKTRINE